VIERTEAETRPGESGALPSPAALVASGVGHAYGGRQALDEVSFRVGSGEIFGFLGPNGAGKSTLFRILSTQVRPLFRILSTQVRPQRGAVEVFGLDLVTEQRAVRRQIGVVFQSPSTDVQLTVAENLRCQGRLYGLDRHTLAARATHYATALGVEDRLDDRVGTLSGGLRRRVEVAKALLHEPRLLLLDEPSSGLDPGARRDLWALLEQLVREAGVTVALTTHFIEEADRCDRLALLDGGRVVEEGAPEALRRQIGGDVVTLTTADPAALRDDLRAHFEIDSTVHAETVRFERPQAHELIGRLAEAFPGRIAAVTVARPTLEDVFLVHTGHSLWEGEA